MRTETLAALLKAINAIGNFISVLPPQESAAEGARNVALMEIATARAALEVECAPKPPRPPRPKSPTAPADGSGAGPTDTGGTPPAPKPSPLGAGASSSTDAPREPTVDGGSGDPAAPAVPPADGLE